MQSSNNHISGIINKEREQIYNPTKPTKVARTISSDEQRTVSLKIPRPKIITKDSCFACDACTQTAPRKKTVCAIM